MKDAADKQTLELKLLGETQQRRRGRPPLGDQAMTSAERQKAYRERFKTNLTTKVGHEGDASRAELMSLLAYSLAYIDSPNSKPKMRSIHKATAKNIMLEIVTRYGIDLGK